MFGAININGKQLFRQYDRFDEDTFYEFLKQIHYKYPKCYLFLDKAPQHYKSQKVWKYFEQHKKDLIPIWLPTASQEFMVMLEHIKERPSYPQVLPIIHRFQKENK